MLFTTTPSTRSQAPSPFAILLIATLLSLINTTSALPAPVRGAAVFQPLFAPASPQVGPARSLERLRLRRSLSSFLSRRTPVKEAPVQRRAAPVNPKGKRAVTPSPTVALISPATGLTPPTNPKNLARRAALAQPIVVLNPKKRSLDTTLPVVEEKRSVAIPLNPKKRAATPVVLNPKKRSVTPVEAPQQREARSFINLVRRMVGAEEAKPVVVRRGVAITQRSATVVATPFTDAQIARAQLIAVGAVASASQSRAVASASSSSSRAAASSSSLAAASSSSAFASSSAAASSSRAAAFAVAWHSAASSRTSASLASATAASISSISSVSSSKAASFRSAWYAAASSRSAATSASLSSSRAAAQTTTTTLRTTTTTSRTTTTTTTTTRTTTTTTSVPTSTVKSWPASGGMIAGGYYPDWQYETLPPDKINYKLFDLINFSFAVPTSTYDVEFIGWNSDTLLKQLVKLAHAADTKVLIAIGGWSSSQYFSDAVRTVANRNTFVANIVKMVNKYGVDGVDIDWEYPGTRGADGNVVRQDVDTANFLKFLRVLRTALPDARISSCSTQRAFIGSDGNPLADVKSFAAVLDNILVMNYDVWGASSTPGSNAPLTNACSNSMQPDANQASAVAAWTKAGMAPSQILMGVPGYGYVSSSTATSLVHKRDEVPAGRPMSNRARANHAHAEELKKRDVPYVSPLHTSYLEGRKRVERREAERAAERRAQEDAAAIAKRDGTIIICPNNHSGKPCAGITDQNITEINWSGLNRTVDGGNSTSNGTTPGVFNPGSVGHTKLGNGDLSGLEGNQIGFWELISYAVLVKSGVNFVGTNGYTRAWDSCSSTPYLYDQSRKVVITYDDPQSLGLKGQLARQEGIAGLMMWEMSQDTVDWQLTQSWRSAMGLRPLGLGT